VGLESHYKIQRERWELKIVCLRSPESAARLWQNIASADESLIA
jgi:hypothetical protein